jgi:hypothetical protein
MTIRNPIGRTPADSRASEERHVWRLLLAATGAAACFAAPLIMQATPSAAAAGVERFSLMDASISQSDVVYSTIATGAFTDGGTASKVGAVLTLQLSKGSITLQIKSKHHGAISEHDCAQTQSSSGDYTITSGTGSYSNITGAGSAIVNVTLVEAGSAGNCSSAPLAAQGTISASGHVSLGA